ncbi:MAG TPA: 2,3-bisphosphoglycerate-independent phosphoglycerate mutase [bacterium]|nr:2,3-bisphosphoglycerate-independent phosphoglycerate mutase [bacterium]
MTDKKKVVLIIRDGWGYNPEVEGNYIRQAQTPNENKYLSTYPHSLLQASGEAVGLEDGYQGNSEVGHMTLGAGRIIFQSLVRINKAIEDGSFFENQAFLSVIKNCQTQNKKLHLIGLLQTQGVHAHLNHLLALLDLCHKENFHNVLIHVITDGRDAPITESLIHVATVQDKLKELGFGQIATISGRYYAMDRDQRWDRTEKAYQAIVEGRASEFTDPLAIITAKHQQGETDEFIEPCRVKNYSGIAENDGIIFFNFRTDRTRQLTQAIIEPEFNSFARSYQRVSFVAMTEYYQKMPALVAFPNISLDNLLGEVISVANLKQLRISETEKYAHVTFFFNGQKEEANLGEDRVLINSPKVATYDLRPEMSVFQIAERLVEEIYSEKYDFIVTNLVNGDMVGHTGNQAAIIKAIEAVDLAQGQIVEAALANGYTCLLLADHGNAEDKTAATMTSHTTNMVPFIVVDNQLKDTKILADGGLADIAPTVLNLLGLPIPSEMTGGNLLIK